MASKDSGRWVTIGAHDGHGGAHVFIKGGKIVKGPAHMVGKAPDEVGKAPAPKPKSKPASKPRPKIETPRHLYEAHGKRDRLKAGINAHRADAANQRLPEAHRLLHRGYADAKQKRLDDLLADIAEAEGRGVKPDAGYPVNAREKNLHEFAGGKRTHLFDVEHGGKRYHVHAEQHRAGGKPQEAYNLRAHAPGEAPKHLGRVPGDFGLGALQDHVEAALPGTAKPHPRLAAEMAVSKRQGPANAPAPAPAPPAKPAAPPPPPPPSGIEGAYGRVNAAGEHRRVNVEKDPAGGYRAKNNEAYDKNIGADTRAAKAVIGKLGYGKIRFKPGDGVNYYTAAGQMRAGKVQEVQPDGKLKIGGGLVDPKHAWVIGKKEPPRPAAAPVPPPAPKPPPTPKPVPVAPPPYKGGHAANDAHREALHGGKVLKSVPLGGGANETHKVELDNGQKGVWKPFSGEEHSLRNDVKGDFYRREAAASAVADAIGMGDLVPPTVVREHNGELGSLQMFAQGAELAARHNSPFDGRTDAERAATYDYVIGHSDRHQGNWMLSGPNDKLVLIDNGLAFPVKNKGQDTYFNREFWRHATAKKYVVAKIDPAAWPQVEAAMSHHGLEPEAIAAAKERFDAVVAHAGKPIASLPAFYWPGKKIGDGKRIR